MEYIVCNQCQTVIRGMGRHRMMMYANRLFCDGSCLDAYQMSLDRILASEAPLPGFGYVSISGDTQIPIRDE